MNNIDHRLQKISRKFLDKSTDAILIFDENNIRYLSGFNGHAATLLLTSQKHFLITDYRYFEHAKTLINDFEVVCRDRINQSLPNLIAELLMQENLNKISFESDHISYANWLAMESELKQINDGFAFVAEAHLVEDLRYYKDESEIRHIKQAASIGDAALSELMPLIKEGARENELAIELEYQLKQKGAQGLAFDTILLFGERAALPHGVPSSRALKKGDFILIDFGAMINGYRSDMTRTFVLGKPDDEQAKVYNTVRAAQQTAINAIEDGVSAEQLSQIADDILIANGYQDYMGEGLGHGVGLDLHESPIMKKGCDLKLSIGSVVTIEPGIYIPGWGGVRIEDDIVLTDQGVELLTQFPRELIRL